MDPGSSLSSSNCRHPCLIGSYYHKLYAEFLFNSMTSARQPAAMQPLHRQFSLRERGERRRALSPQLLPPPADLLAPPAPVQQDPSPSPTPFPDMPRLMHQARRPSVSSSTGDSGLSGNSCLSRCNNSSSSSSCSCDSGLPSPASATAPSQAKTTSSSTGSQKSTTSHQKSATGAAALPAFKRRKERWQCDLKSLDELVRELINECTCPQTFPMKRLEEGKYLFGDSKMLIFVRVLRSHVMVRVGGGWDSLEHMLLRHDPCRSQPVGYKGGAPLLGGSGSGVAAPPVSHRQEDQLSKQQQQNQDPSSSGSLTAATTTTTTKTSIIDDGVFVRPMVPPAPSQISAAAGAKKPLSQQQQQQQHLHHHHQTSRNGSSTGQPQAKKTQQQRLPNSAASPSPRRASLQPSSLSPSPTPSPSKQRSQHLVQQPAAPAKLASQQPLGSQSCQLPRKRYNNSNSNINTSSNSSGLASSRNNRTGV